MTEPLVPLSVDLRDFGYMPLDVVRLRDCDTVIMTSGDGFKAAVLLWCASWHQLPAASLPDDDRMLAHLAGFGRDVKAWLSISSEALRGFVKCSDGRLYHPHIAAKAVEAWEAKTRQRERTAAARAAKLAAKSVAPKEDCSNSVCDNDQSISVTECVTSSVTQIVTSSKGREGKGEDNPEIQDNPLDARSASPPAPRKASRAKARTQIAPDQKPTEADAKAAVGIGLTGEQFIAEWRKFRDHHLAKGSLMLDWSAAWRTWLGRVPEYQRQPRAGPRQSDRGGFQSMLADVLRSENDHKRQNEGFADDVLLLPVDRDNGPGDGGGDDGGVSRNAVELLVGNSFRRM